MVDWTIVPTKNLLENRFCCILSTFTCFIKLAFIMRELSPTTVAVAHLFTNPIQVTVLPFRKDDLSLVSCFAILIFVGLSCYAESLSQPPLQRWRRLKKRDLLGLVVIL
jgi:hypothetical protein